MIYWFIIVCILGLLKTYNMWILRYGNKNPLWQWSRLRGHAGWGTRGQGCLSTERRRGLALCSTEADGTAGYCQEKPAAQMLPSWFDLRTQNKYLFSKHKNMCITFVQCWLNVFDVEPTLYKCYTNVLCLLGIFPSDWAIVVIVAPS